ncbi:MAG: potassium transporter, partial [Spirochaetales bacterium]|nr:potassium transporter [Spirochaetales bacterium]
FLIQFGGLGIITFTTMFFIAPRDRKISFRNISMVKKYYIDSVEHNANHILRNIILLTVLIELIGTLLLYAAFSGAETELERPLFTALFHAVSAFCNAGFSLFTNSLETYSSNPLILFTIAFLIIAGGIGFLVYQDTARVFISKSKKRFALHTKIAVITSVFLLVFGTLVYYLLERNGVFGEQSEYEKWMNAFFQSVTTRTAGFNAVDQRSMSGASQFFTLPLMFIGGSPGSIAGGIKTTTAFILIAAMFRDINSRGKITIGGRSIPSRIVSRGMLFFGKAMVLLVLSIFLLALTEMGGENPGAVSLTEILFESFSAFGTVGLSLGITGDLTDLGKIVIILTMFAGRVGLISMSIPLFMEKQENIDYPEEEVLIG